MKAIWTSRKSGDWGQIAFDLFLLEIHRDHEHICFGISQYPAEVVLSLRHY